MAFAEVCVRGGLWSRLRLIERGGDLAVKRIARRGLHGFGGIGAQQVDGIAELQCCQLDSARGGFVGGMAIAPAFSSWTAVAREEAIGAVDTLPGMETEAEQNHALEEISAGRAHCVGRLTSFAVNLTHASRPMQLDAGCVRYFARGTFQILGWMLIRVARSALRGVGEFEDLSCDGQDDIDEMGLPIALEVDAVVWGALFFRCRICWLALSANLLRRSEGGTFAIGQLEGENPAARS
jgi:hypothetical protein